MDTLNINGNSYSIEVLTFEEYCRKLKIPIKNNLQEVQEYADEHLDVSLWDYPVSEVDYCIREGIKVVLVNTDTGHRLCEIL